MKRGLLIGGGIAAALGLLIGLMPLSSGGADCGSAFAGSNIYTVLALYGLPAVEGCQSIRSLVRIPAVALLVVGGILAVASLTIQSKTPEAVR